MVKRDQNRKNKEKFKIKNNYKKVKKMLEIIFFSSIILL